IDEKGDIRPEAESAVMQQLHAHFRPEFLNRLDEIILFKPLTKDNISRIVDLMMNDVNRRLEDRQIRVELTEAARRYVIDNGFDPQYGARPLRRYLQRTVDTLAAKQILAGSISEGDTIEIDLTDGKLTARDKKPQAE
ncbi:MAG: type VI secretion system ATPase TssH, partial [Lachnospira sp.]|nr:type VI secretion system ATPase TssH [Lachnospira sp.]